VHFGGIVFFVFAFGSDLLRLATNISLIFYCFQDEREMGAAIKSQEIFLILTEMLFVIYGLYLSSDIIVMTIEV
jgi:hypothetical protein